tara:strand:+ start:279 stop:686 length:408 start_codon:yes stop_codon:yes gene_type:complete
MPLKGIKIATPLFPPWRSFKRPPKLFFTKSETPQPHSSSPIGSKGIPELLARSGHRVRLAVPGTPTPKDFPTEFVRHFDSLLQSAFTDRRILNRNQNAKALGEDGPWENKQRNQHDHVSFISHTRPGKHDATLDS